MKFWDDSLRICPKCKAKVRFDGQERKPCQRCRSQVYFFHYRPLPAPPRIPEPSKYDFFGHPTSSWLLVILTLLSLAAVLAFSQALIVSMVSILIGVGFLIYGMMRHSEAAAAENKLAHHIKVLELAEAFRNQTAELIERYNSLLSTGNARIEHYYGTIYEAAEEEKNKTQQLQAKVAADRTAIRNVEERIYAMAERLVKDHLKWMTEKLRADPENYQRRRATLTKTFHFVESVGYSLPDGIRQQAIADLKRAYQSKVREQMLKDEQRRINQQMREEARLLKQQEKEIREAEAREAELANRLEEALIAQHGVHTQEIEELQRQLAAAQAQAKAERAKSLAQLTRVGHVYILSNIGSFGENVFKVGMTRREDPDHRVRELGDASVPFPFDVHAMIGCEDAPALENALHRELTRHRVNRVNLRKEYFNVELEVILDAVRKHHGTIEYVAEPEALEYRETQTISPEELVERSEELAEMGINLNEDDELELAGA